MTATNKGLEVVSHIDPNMPFQLRGDSDRLKQVRMIDDCDDDSDDDDDDDDSSEGAMVLTTPSFPPSRLC